MSETETIKVMVVDDHPIVLDGLEATLHVDNGLELVGKAESGMDALALCQESLPDVILMDLFMPGMDGIETTRAVLKKYPDVKVIVLTSFPEQELVQHALEAGAIGYLLKNVSIATLTQAIRSAYAGGSSFSSETARILFKAKENHSRLGEDLSKREREVLALVVKGLSNEEIAARLVISPFTAKNHVSAIISKLEAANRTEAATIAVENRLIPTSSSNL